jgi:hypothetical protein
MPDEMTLLERARAARERRNRADAQSWWQRDEVNLRHGLAAANLLLETNLTMADLRQGSVGEDLEPSGYHFEVEGHTFSLSGSSMTVYGRCRVGGELMPAGTISFFSINTAQAMGSEYRSQDRDKDLAKLADLLDAVPVCEAHQEQAATLDDRIREIVRDEIDRAGLAEDGHAHSELANEQHEHYDLANIHHSHEDYADQQHDHYGEYADVQHSHNGYY